MEISANKSCEKSMLEACKNTPITENVYCMMLWTNGPLGERPVNNFSKLPFEENDFSRFFAGLQQKIVI